MVARPKANTTKHNQYRLRMTDEESEKLEYCSKITGLTKAEVIRKGIDLILNKKEKQNEC